MKRKGNTTNALNGVAQKKKFKKNVGKKQQQAKQVTKEDEIVLSATRFSDEPILSTPVLLIRLH